WRRGSSTSGQEDRHQNHCEEGQEVSYFLPDILYNCVVSSVIHHAVQCTRRIASDSWCFHLLSSKSLFQSQRSSLMARFRLKYCWLRFFRYRWDACLKCQCSGSVPLPPTRLVRLRFAPRHSLL